MVLGYDLKLWEQYQMKCGINVEIPKLPHILMSSPSGSGKSYALKWIVRNLINSYNVELTFCNFKDSSDFRFLRDCSDCSYYTVNDCLTGFNKFYDGFKKAQEQAHEYDGVLHVLIFDEFQAFINATNMAQKKLGTQIQSQLSEMLCLSRSYGYCLFIVCQRASASLFPEGTRDNFFIYNDKFRES